MPGVTAPPAAVAEATLHALFERQAAHAPDADAAAFQDLTLSYAELNARAQPVPRDGWVERGAGPERFVAIMLPRSPDLVVAVLAGAEARVPRMYRWTRPTRTSESAWASSTWTSPP